MVYPKETTEICRYWVEYFLVKDMIGAFLFIYLFDHLVYSSFYEKIS
jgi:hypothetical protein